MIVGVAPRGIVTVSGLLLLLLLGNEKCNELVESFSTLSCVIYERKDKDGRGNENKKQTETTAAAARVGTPQLLAFSFFFKRSFSQFSLALFVIFYFFFQLEILYIASRIVTLFWPQSFNRIQQ